MSNPSIVLVDTSGSTTEPVGARRRIDVLRQILADVLAATIPPPRLFAFASTTREIDGAAHLPEPGGGTDLAAACDCVAPLRPGRVIIISDGEPNDVEAALAAARALDCQITTYYCGDERNYAAIAFLRALAWCSSDGLGQAAIGDLRQPARVTAELRLALAGPLG